MDFNWSDHEVALTPESNKRSTSHAEDSIYLHKHAEFYDEKHARKPTDSLT
jgi:hypothetical protein